MQILYADTQEYCNDKNLATSGDFINCHFEYMKKKKPQLLEDYKKIRNYCANISDTTFDTWECVEKVILK